MVGPGSSRKYRIEKYLAEGGMGAVYLGKKIGAQGFEKEVVLKQLLPEFTARPEFRDLFFREAKISGSLDHVNIVRTIDLVASADALFIVMEYVPGADLRTIAWRARLQRRDLSPAAILHIAMEVLAGLDYAHARRSETGELLGIIHRDVSPSNILCSAQGDVKLSDFGIAKATTFASVFYRVRGKVGYMSPEQARNEKLDGRSDLFSLAVCILETLTGERVFTGDLQTPPDQIYSQPIPRACSRRSDLPAGLDAVMAKALALDPAQRFAKACDFADALRQVARAHDLLFSAPALAAELVEVMGVRAESWLAEDKTEGHKTQRLPPAHTLEGREASSLPLGGIASLPRLSFGPAKAIGAPLQAPNPTTDAPGRALKSPLPLRGSRTRAAILCTLLGACLLGAAVAYAVLR